MAKRKTKKMSNKQTRAYLLFMDESGDQGFKFDRGSSRFFVLCLVIFDETKNAEKTSSKIQSLRQELKLPAKFEFKFSTGTTNKIKEKFLKSLKSEKFFYRAVVIDKKKLLKTRPESMQEVIYLLASEILFLRGRQLTQITLVLDRINRQFLRKMDFFLKRRLNTRLSKIIKKVKADNSANNNLLQLADMICGAIFRKFTKKDERFYKIMKEKEEELYVPY